MTNVKTWSPWVVAAFAAAVLPAACGDSGALGDGGVAGAPVGIVAGGSSPSSSSGAGAGSPGDGTGSSSSGGGSGAAVAGAPPICTPTLGIVPTVVGPIASDPAGSASRNYPWLLLGSCNIGGGRLFHVLSGNLSHQIEHHLFPDLPSNRYPDLAPRVRALAARYDLPCNTGSLSRQFGSTVWKIICFSLPGPAVRATPA